MPNVPEAVKDFLNNIAALSTVLGFGLIGVFVAIRKAVSYGHRKVTSHRDKAYFKDLYLHYKGLAVEDGCYSASDTKSLVTAIREREQSLKASISVALRDRLRAHLDQRASGSTTLTLADLVREDGLRLPLRFADHLSSKALSIFDLFERLRLASGQPSTVSGRILLLGAAGWGKSLTCLWLAARSTLAVEGSATSKAVLLLSANDVGLVGSEKALGSVDWLVDVISHRLARTSLSELRRQMVTDFVRYHAIVVFDGLDELFERVGSNVAEAFTRSWTFEHAQLITTRASHYESNLRGAPSVRHHELVDILEASLSERLEFIREVCLRRYAQTAEAQISVIEGMLTQSRSLEQITRTPLMLMMLTEIPVRDLSAQKSIYSIDIYDTFIEQLMRRDSDRLRNTASNEEMAAIFWRLAWRMYELSRVAQFASGGLDLAELRAVLTSGSVRLSSESLQLEAVVLDSPLLRVSRVDPGDRSSILVSFSHESFLEFLVASLVSQWARGLEQQGAGFFEHLESPGVSVFLKEYLDKLRVNPVAKAKARVALLDQLDQLVARRSIASSERDGRIATFTLGQVAYYLAMLADDNTASRISDVVAKCGDFWVRRCAAIGLAFGGRASEFDRLLDELFDSVISQDFFLARKNVAIELAFYGDQAFDRLDPCADAGLSNCRRLLTTVVREMQMDIEAANWRMCLFNIFYLAFYRPESEVSFAAVMAELRDDMMKIINLHLSRSDTRSSQQLYQIKALLERRQGTEGDPE